MFYITNKALLTVWHVLIICFRNQMDVSCSTTFMNGGSGYEPHKRCMWCQDGMEKVIRMRMSFGMGVTARGGHCGVAEWVK